jgi:ferric-dicitrate binding protein FerR (iron transport regulator)
MSLRFSAARFVLFSAADKIAVVVLEGRVKGVTPEGAVVILAAGETLEAQQGERLGSPMPAELDRLNKWWEEIR